MAVMKTLIDMTFTETVTTEGSHAWTCVVVPDSGEVLGTRRVVKVLGTVDGDPVQLTLLPIGDGTHLAPLRGQTVGADVTVHLDRRLA